MNVISLLAASGGRRRTARSAPAMTTRTIQNSRLFRVEFTDVPSMHFQDYHAGLGRRDPALIRDRHARHPHNSPCRVDHDRHAIAFGARALSGRRTGPAACDARARPSGRNRSPGRRFRTDQRQRQRLGLQQRRPPSPLASARPASLVLLIRRRRSRARLPESAPSPGTGQRDTRTAPAAPARPPADRNRQIRPRALDLQARQVQVAARLIGASQPHRCGPRSRRNRRPAAGGLDARPPRTDSRQRASGSRQVGRRRRRQGLRHRPAIGHGHVL